MKAGTEQATQFLYTFACHEDEVSLSRLERRILFGEMGAGIGSPAPILKSRVCIEPSRSPFIKERIDILYEADSLDEIAEQVQDLLVAAGTTFKIVYVKRNDLPPAAKIEYADQRGIERMLGARISGKADVKTPDNLFGIVPYGGRWYFGFYRESQAEWLRHMHKPRSYSIALPTRLARAVANIAVPEPEPATAGIRAIDPCCGIGTVLVEALSMGIDIVGRDINPLAVRGARENIAYFGYAGLVELGSVADVQAHYDTAIVDLPYNHVSRITAEQQFEIVRHTRRIADRAVFVAIEPMDELLAAAGFAVIDRCVASKGEGAFSRNIVVCR